MCSLFWNYLVDIANHIYQWEVLLDITYKYGTQDPGQLLDLQVTLFSHFSQGKPCHCSSISSSMIIKWAFSVRCMLKNDHSRICSFSGGVCLHGPFSNWQGGYINTHCYIYCIAHLMVGGTIELVT